jgi:hypothetical protein
MEKLKNILSKSSKTIYQNLIENFSIASEKLGIAIAQGVSEDKLSKLKKDFTIALNAIEVFLKNEIENFKMKKDIVLST